MWNTRNTQRLLLLGLAGAALMGCGGGGTTEVVSPAGSTATSPPSASTLSVDGDTKQLQFSWTAASDVEFYQLLEDPDGMSGFSQVGSDLPASATSTNLDIAVHFHNWPDARYALDACNAVGCTRSNEVDTQAVMLDAIGYFKASNTEAGDDYSFRAVAVSGDGNTVAVGAWKEDSAATGIDGDQTDNSATWAGAVYVFTRSSEGVWSQQAYVKASNTDPGDTFGRAVALSGDGNTLAVGAIGEDSDATGVDGDQGNFIQDAGAVYVFTRSGSTWSQQAYIKASNTEPAAPIGNPGDIFGIVVALSNDGNTLAVSAMFEDSSATGIDGDQSDNSADNAGAVYVFTRSGSTWSQQAYVKASNTEAGDLFGFSLALSGDGNTLAVGAIGEDSDATGIDGDQSDNSADDAGAAYVFTRTGSTWSQQAYVKASNAEALDQFGEGVALNGDGNTLAVGARGEDSSASGVNGDQTNNDVIRSGAAYVFTRALGAWSQEAYVKPSNTTDGDVDGDKGFGNSVALSSDGNTLAVGATGERTAATGVNGDQANDCFSAQNCAPSAGAAYVLTRSGSTWSHQAYVKASNTEDGDMFGGSLALSDDGNTLAVGAREEDSAATGVNGDQTDNSADNAGAAYLY